MMGKSKLPSYAYLSREAVQRQDAQTRKSTGAFLQPQKTGVSYMKSRSLHGNGAPDAGRKDATVFKNNDDDVGYRSSARRRVGQDGRSPSPALSDRSADEMNTEQLKKAIREKQVLLDAMDFEDESHADQEDALDRKDRKESEDLFRRIRHMQEDIDTHPKIAVADELDRTESGPASRHPATRFSSPPMISLSCRTELFSHVMVPNW